MPFFPTSPSFSSSRRSRIMTQSKSYFPLSRQSKKPFFMSQFRGRRIETAGTFTSRHRAMGRRGGFPELPTGHDWRAELLTLSRDAPPERAAPGDTHIEKSGSPRVATERDVQARGTTEIPPQVVRSLQFHDARAEASSDKHVHGRHTARPHRSCCLA